MENGLYCVGCCLGLMAVLFALGVMSVFWMVVIAAVIFVEKVFLNGPRLTRAEHRRPDPPWPMGRSLAFERSDADRAWAVTVHGNGDGDLAAGIIGRHVGRTARFQECGLPARDAAASVEAWTAVLGQEPAFVGEDFAVFTGDGAEIGLSSAPWVEHPLVFWEVAEIEEAHRALVAAGAIR